MKKVSSALALLLCLFLLTACAAQPAVTTVKPTSAPTTVQTEPAPQGIKNIILIIGDGMGDAQIRAGELASGETFVFRDWQHIHANTDSLHSDGTPGKLTDSAAAGTALATGQLTTNGKVGQGPNSTDPLTTILDHAHDHNKSTGVVTTDTIYGATPSAFSGHAVDRTDHQTILYSQLTSNVNLLCSDFDSETYALKSQITTAGYTFCDFFSKIGETMSAEKVYWQFDMAGTSATNKLEKVVPYALEYLSQDEDGFVLIIEQAHVDKYSHNNEIDGAQQSANSLNRTVEAVLNWVGDRDDTAIIITADHETGGLSVSETEEYENRYVSPVGHTLYYQWSTTGHTATPVSVYVYGFTPDFSQYRLEGETDLIKNTAVFRMMLSILEDPMQNLPVNSK